MSLNAVSFSKSISVEPTDTNQSITQLSPEEFNNTINQIISDDLKNHYSKEYMTDQIVELAKQNLDTTKELKIEPDFQTIKRAIVEPSVNFLDKSTLQKKPCTAKGYLNFNISIPLATTGVMLNSCSESFVYGGIALSSPSFAITASPDSISEGWNNVFQYGFGAGFSIGADSNQNLSREGGIVTNGVSLSKFYVIKIN